MYRCEFVVFVKCLMLKDSSGSSGRVRGAEKHEIYAAAFGGHLFYDLFLQGQGGPWPPWPPLDLLLIEYRNFGLILNNFHQGRCKRTYEFRPHFVTIKRDSVYILEE